MKIVIASILLLLSTTALAIDDFKCVVKEVYAITEKGLLIPSKGFATPDVGSEFVVNGQSGQITGSKFTNTMSGVMPTVYNYLPNENSYKAITIYKPNLTVDYLEILTYKKTKGLPFIYKGAFGEVVTGICKIM